MHSKHEGSFTRVSVLSFFDWTSPHSLTNVPVLWKVKKERTQRDNERTYEGQKGSLTIIFMDSWPDLTQKLVKDLFFGQFHGTNTLPRVGGELEKKERIWERKIEWEIEGLALARCTHSKKEI